MKKNKNNEQTPLSFGHLPLKKGEVLKHKGFTLIELLVVISIIAILVLATSSSFVNSQKKSRDASRKSELKSLANALNMYYADKGSFPATTTIKSLISNQGEFADTTSPNNKVVYMKKVPNGSSSGTKEMSYEASSTGRSFRLYANLENNEDKDCLSPAQCSNLGYSVTIGCCYVITSSNIGTTEALN